jgi:hypothetical protein
MLVLHLLSRDMLPSANGEERIFYDAWRRFPLYRDHAGSHSETQSLLSSDRAMVNMTDYRTAESKYRARSGTGYNTHESWRVLKMEHLFTT